MVGALGPDHRQWSRSRDCYLIAGTKKATLNSGLNCLILLVEQVMRRQTNSPCRIAVQHGVKFKNFLVANCSTIRRTRLFRNSFFVVSEFSPARLRRKSDAGSTPILEPWIFAENFTDFQTISAGPAQRPV
ncbi:MAG: hypothetical protein HQL95_05140 [Magnetococcales bacterium]|nr:hypothetical protein [Magnetococcales bacterium]